ncbi:MAG: hypothetical protein KJZ83_15050 [Burkholderiaceae bacterium]|nr:hypothetical protein [Burkholderiaceae bacterium]
MNSRQDVQSDTGFTLRMCALCPSPCRAAWPADLPAPLESELPSGLALLAMAVLDGQVVFDDGLKNALHVKPGARVCVEQCVYGLDIVGAIVRVRGASVEDGLS